MSLKSDPEAATVVYPPHAGDDYGPCMEYPGSCSCIDCNLMHSFARKVCPVCGEPMGYGNRVMVRRPEVPYYVVVVNGEPVHLFGMDGEPLAVHADCYEKAKEVPPDHA